MNHLRRNSLIMHHRTIKKRHHLIRCVVNNAIELKHIKHDPQEEIIYNNLMVSVFELELHRKKYPELLDIERDIL